MREKKKEREREKEGKKKRERKKERKRERGEGKWKRGGLVLCFFRKGLSALYNGEWEEEKKDETRDKFERGSRETRFLFFW